MTDNPDQPVILVCAFEGEGFVDGINVSEWVAERIQTQYPDARIEVAILPVDFNEIDQRLEELTSTYNPDYIIGMGEKNYVDMRRAPDNMEVEIAYEGQNEFKPSMVEGADARDVNANGPQIYNGSNGLKDLADQDGPLSVRFVSNAGINECNYLYYKSLQYMESVGTPGNASFFHLDDPFARSRHLSGTDKKLAAIEKYQELAEDLNLSPEIIERMETVLAQAQSLEQLRANKMQRSGNNQTQNTAGENKKEAGKAQSGTTVKSVNQELNDVLNTIEDELTAQGIAIEGLEIGEYREATEQELLEYDTYSDQYATLVDGLIQQITEHLNPDDNLISESDRALNNFPPVIIAP